MNFNQFRIPLTQGKYALVDACDYEYLIQWKWCYLKHQSSGGYAVRNDGKQTIYMHRIILERMNCENFVRSDHINRDKLDNRRSNLRPATNHQSSCNQGKYKNNTSGYTGVSWHQGKWLALIQVNRKQKFLGCYDNKKEAALAYNKAARKYHGKFAVLNEV